jgi:hypothetical protein
MGSREFFVRDLKTHLHPRLENFPDFTDVWSHVSARRYAGAGGNTERMIAPSRRHVSTAYSDRPRSRDP